MFTINQVFYDVDRVVLFHHLISCSGNQTISGNIISTGNIQTTSISSTSINNTSSITTSTINSNTEALTNLTVNVLTLLANTPLNYVNQQISNLVNSSPDLLNTLSE
jgi:hypothetical protein